MAKSKTPQDLLPLNRFFARRHQARRHALRPLSLSLRKVEDLPSERGIDTRHAVVEPPRPHVRRRNPPQAGAAMRQFTHWGWRLDEVYLKVNGEMFYLWRLAG